MKAIENFIEALMSNKIAIEFKQQQLRRGSKGLTKIIKLVVHSTSYRLVHMLVLYSLSIHFLTSRASVENNISIISP